MQELDGATLTYAVFRDACLVPNRPAIIRGATAAGGFHVPTLMAQLSPTGLCRTLGRQHKVPVYHVHHAGRAAVDDEATPRAKDAVEPDCGEYHCEERPLEAVLASWAACGARADTAAPERVYYLKDWHMQSDMERVRAASAPRACVDSTNTSVRQHGGELYEVPHYLGPDWMDAFCVAVMAGAAGLRGFGDGRHDYRFAYVGAVGTWTGLHHDVFGTYSWSFNVCGDKLWLFPDEEGNRYLLEHLVRGFPPPPDIRVLTGFRYVSVVQRPGDLVFVPSRYFHQVHNVGGHSFSFRPDGAHEDVSMDLTIAVNHNWCNEFCIAAMVDVFLDDVDTLLKFLDVGDLKLIFGEDDPDAWRAHVDFLLQSGSNWSFASVLSFLAHCASVVGVGGDGRIAELLRELTEKVQQRRQSMFA